jgi:tetratricopeptide (TPR) repeat protein
MSSYHLSTNTNAHTNEPPVKASTSSSSSNTANTAACPADATTTTTALPAMLESIARQNNLGVACLHSNDSREAGNALKRALEKANAMTFFSASAGRRPASGTEVSKNLYIYQRGEYDEGMHTFSTPIPLDDLRGLSMHAVTATILFNLGQLYLRMNEEQEATDAFLQALQLMHMGTPLPLTVPKKDGSLPLQISFMALYHNLGHLQYRQGHYEDAVRTYSKALEVGRANPHPSSHQLLELAATLNCLGVLCFHLPQADTEQAMALYQESLQIRYAVLGRDAQTKEIATTVSTPTTAIQSVLVSTHSVLTKFFPSSR